LIALVALGCGDDDPTPDATQDTADTAENPCLDKQSCTRFGKCTPMHGVCMAGSDADCAQSIGCKEDGECVSAPPCWDKGPDGHTAHLACWPQAAIHPDKRCGQICTDTQQCVDDPDCKTWGSCVCQDGECWAPGTTRDECAKPVDDQGVETLEKGCENFGFCTPKDGICQAFEPEDCTGRYVCTQWNECVALDGECWQTAAP